MTCELCGQLRQDVEIIITNPGDMPLNICTPCARNFDDFLTDLRNENRRKVRLEFDSRKELLLNQLSKNLEERLK